MKTLKLLTLLAVIQCAQPMLAMEKQDKHEKLVHGQFVALLLAIHNYNTRLASLYIEQDTTLSTDPRLPQIAPEIQTIKAQLPALETRHDDLLSQTQADAPSFLSDTSDRRHAAIQRTKEIIADAKNDAKEKKEFLIKHAFHHLTFGPAWHDRAQKTLTIAQDNAALMSSLQAQLDSAQTLSHHDRKALTTKRSHVEIGTAALLATNIKDLQEQNAQSDKDKHCDKSLIDQLIALQTK